MLSLIDSFKKRVSEVDQTVHVFFAYAFSNLFNLFVSKYILSHFGSVSFGKYMELSLFSFLLSNVVSAVRDIIPKYCSKYIREKNDEKVIAFLMRISFFSLCMILVGPFVWYFPGFLLNIFFPGNGYNIDTLGIIMGGQGLSPETINIFLLILIQEIIKIPYATLSTIGKTYHLSAPTFFSKSSGSFLNFVSTQGLRFVLIYACSYEEKELSKVGFSIAIIPKIIKNLCMGLIAYYFVITSVAFNALRKKISSKGYFSLLNDHSFEDINTNDIALTTSNYHFLVLFLSCEYYLPKTFMLAAFPTFLGYNLYSMGSIFQAVYHVTQSTTRVLNIYVSKELVTKKKLDVSNKQTILKKILLLSGLSFFWILVQTVIEFGYSPSFDYTVFGSIETYFFYFSIIMFDFFIRAIVSSFEAYHIKFEQNQTNLLKLSILLIKVFVVSFMCSSETQAAIFFLLISIFHLSMYVFVLCKDVCFSFLEKPTIIKKNKLKKEK